MAQGIGFPFTIVEPPYWREACVALSESDPVMARLIERFKGRALKGGYEPFKMLVRFIIEQQISLKTADKVWERFVKACPEMTPLLVSRKHRRTLRSVGLSERKIDCIWDICRFFIEEEQQMVDYDRLDDQEIVKRLMSIKGVDEWMAQMFLIFVLHRPNVLPLSDTRLIKAIENEYFDSEMFNGMEISERRRKLDQITTCWNPWRTVATWYMWQSFEANTVSY